MELNLSKPLAFFDLETTGTNISSDRIVEISILKAMPDGSTQVYTKRVNPEMEIPAESSAIHGITNEDVALCPTFQDLATEIDGFLADCDLGGYNSNRFDIPLLAEEFLRAGVEFDISRRRSVDVQAIFHKKEPRDLTAAYRFYCDQELEGAHGAEADIKATYEILKAQLDRYPDLVNDVDELSKYTTRNNKVADLAGRLSYDADGDVCFAFGKHSGKKVTEVLRREPAYYDWMMSKDFPGYTKMVLKRVKETGK